MTLRKCAYKECSQRFDKTAGIVHNILAFCSDGHAIQYAMAAGRKLRVKRSADKKKAFKENDLPHQKELTQAVFNKMIRLLDKYFGCISCNKPASWGGQWHAGHLLSVGSMPSLRYDARNCHKQCSQCNNFLSGSLAGYKYGLLKRHGHALVIWLEGPHPAAKYTCADLIAMRKEFKAEIKRLENGEEPSRDWRRLDEH